ncbi:MAG: tryptophan 7-halogenase [Nitrospinae bacterium]|nr:tryptophan 7-halogenase [Nitrospinota bacterium]
MSAEQNGVDYDVVIIGGGPAGAVAAAGLVREGRKVAVFEKETFPRFVIGESLLPSSNDILSRVGLYDAVADAKFLKKEGALFFMDGKIERFNFAETSAGGWDFAYQVPRADFDSVLINKAASMGADVTFGAAVTGVAFDDDTVTLTVRQGQVDRTVTGKWLIDCSGYGRALASNLDLDAPSTLPVREALFTHITGDRRPAGSDEGYIWIVVLPQGGWIWVIPFSDGRTSVGVVAEPSLFVSDTESDAQLLTRLLTQEPCLAERLGDMRFVMETRRIKGYSVGIKSLHGPRYLLTGNATEFLDPVFSSGVTLAMESAHRAQAMVNRALNGETVDFDAEYDAYVMRGVNCFRSYVTSWYTGELKSLFFNATKPEKIKRRVCSVLAGYVWDLNNPFAAQSGEALAATFATIADPRKGAVGG